MLPALTGSRSQTKYIFIRLELLPIARRIGVSVVNRPIILTRAFSRSVCISSSVWSVCLVDKACLLDRRDVKLSDEKKKKL